MTSATGGGSGLTINGQWVSLQLRSHGADHPVRPGSDRPGPDVGAHRLITADWVSRLRRTLPMDQWRRDSLRGGVSGGVTHVVGRTVVHTSSGRVLTLLYKEHAADAFRYALHLTGRRADAEDIVQHVFLQAHRHLESGRELVSPRAWLLTAVKHRAFNLIRDRREVPVDRPVIPVESSETSAEEAAQLAEVRAMLWTLPEAQHHAFVLRHWSGLSQSEIADVLETTPLRSSRCSAVRGRRSCARMTRASDACSQVRHRLLESTELGAADLAHLGACRPCRHARDRLARAANLAGTLALVPGTHVAHAIAGLVPGFSAHAATSTAAAIGSAGGAGAGAGCAGASLGTTTAVTTAGKAAVIAKAAIAVAAATAAVGAVPAAHHSLAALIASAFADDRLARCPPCQPCRGGARPGTRRPRLPRVADDGATRNRAGRRERPRAGREPRHHAAPAGGSERRRHPAPASPRGGRADRGTGTASGPAATGKPWGKPAGVGGGNGNAGGKPAGTGGNASGNGNAGGNGNGKPADPGNGKPA